MEEVTDLRSAIELRRPAIEIREFRTRLTMKLRELGATAEEVEEAFRIIDIARDADGLLVWRYREDIANQEGWIS